MLHHVKSQFNNKPIKNGLKKVENKDIPFKGIVHLEWRKVVPQAPKKPFMTEVQVGYSEPFQNDIVIQALAKAHKAKFG